MLFYYFENQSEFFEAWQFMKGQKTSFTLFHSKFIVIHLSEYQNYIKCTHVYKCKVPEDILSKCTPNMATGLRNLFC